MFFISPIVNRRGQEKDPIYNDKIMFLFCTTLTQYKICISRALSLNPHHSIGLIFFFCLQVYTSSRSLFTYCVIMCGWCLYCSRKCRGGEIIVIYTDQVNAKGREDTRLIKFAVDCILLRLKLKCT